MDNYRFKQHYNKNKYSVDDATEVAETIRQGLTKIAKELLGQNESKKEQSQASDNSFSITSIPDNTQQPHIVQTDKTQEKYIQWYNEVGTKIKQQYSTKAQESCKHQEVVQSIESTETQTIISQRNPELDIVISFIIAAYLEKTTKIKDFTGSEYIDDSRASRYSRFAAHSYREYSDLLLPKNCTIIEKHDDVMGLRATLYDDGDDVVCAFAGTEKTNIKDWAANISQVGGLSEQYEEALQYGREVCQRYPNKNVIFVGHSKGGGQAAYCAYNLGKKAETYNPAGLSIITKYLKGSIRDNAEVNAYVFCTDVLNTLQDVFSPIIGADGNRHDITDANVVDHGRHGIEGILRYFKIRYKY